MGELSRTRALENSRRIKFEYGSSEVRLFLRCVCAVLALP
jgi:hypothetical protein